MADKTPVEICEAIALDFKRRRITHKMAAERIGKTKSSVSNQISGKKPFSKGMAELFADAFSYNIDFLLYGKGELKQTSPTHTAGYTISAIVADGFDTSFFPFLLDAADSLLVLSGNQAVLKTWDSLLCGDFEGYKKSIAVLDKDSHFRPISLVTAKLLCDSIKKVLGSFKGAQPVGINPDDFSPPFFESHDR